MFRSKNKKKEKKIDEPEDDQEALKLKLAPARRQLAEETGKNRKIMENDRSNDEILILKEKLKTVTEMLDKGSQKILEENEKLRTINNRLSEDLNSTRSAIPILSQMHSSQVKDLISDLDQARLESNRFKIWGDQLKIQLNDANSDRNMTRRANNKLAKQVRKLKDTRKELVEDLSQKTVELLNTSLQYELRIRELEEQHGEPPTCEICEYPYSEDGPTVPMILECGHTFCRSCISKMSTAYAVECPLDRLSTDVYFGGNLKKNYLVCQIVRSRVSTVTDC
ncbi:unnamed protein product [Caenorhabditis sp. 36 PRJEB53466]|nr:unnamed protein product [Caenorhabditis sp. 36 PRJEB53466]